MSAIPDVPTPAENGAAAAEIARIGGPESAWLVVQIMDMNARERESLEARIQSSIERELDEWKSRALAAEDKLARIQDRFLQIVEF